jgi:hypothetical protein
MIRFSLPCTLLLLAVAAPAAAMVKLPELPVPIAGNPADRLLSLPIEDAHRDHVHIGMTKRGAAARTSFWSRGR